MGQQTTQEKAFLLGGLLSFSPKCSIFRIVLVTAHTQTQVALILRLKIQKSGSFQFLLTSLKRLSSMLTLISNRLGMTA